MLLCCLAKAERGDVTGDRPMWCEDGSLDYQRQEEYDAWSKAKVRKDLSQIEGSLSSRLR